MAPPPGDVLAETLLSTGTVLVTHLDVPLVVSFKRQDEREQLRVACDLLHPWDRTIIMARCEGLYGREIGRMMDLSQPSISTRLSYAARWLQWVVPRRACLVRRYGEDGVPEHFIGEAAFERRPRNPIDMAVAWRLIVWTHRPLAESVGAVGATSQGQLRHRWCTAMLHTVADAKGDALLTSVLREVEAYPTRWRRPNVDQALRVRVRARVAQAAGSTG